jgi:hypothetical protein
MNHIPLRSHPVSFNHTDGNIGLFRQVAFAAAGRIFELECASDKVLCAMDKSVTTHEAVYYKVDVHARSHSVHAVL